MKRILFVAMLFLTANSFGQKSIEKPASTGATEVDQYVDKCFEFWSTARKLNEKVKSIDAEVNTGKLSEQEMKNKKEELNNIMREATAEQKKGEELTAQSSQMPEKAKAAVQGNPLKAGKIMKNLSKASDALKDGTEENMQCIKSIPTLTEKIKTREKV